MRLRMASISSIGARASVHGPPAPRNTSVPLHDRRQAERCLLVGARPRRERAARARRARRTGPRVAARAPRAADEVAEARPALGAVEASRRVPLIAEPAAQRVTPVLRRSLPCLTCPPQLARAR